jgi:hypothetical protein
MPDKPQACPKCGEPLAENGMKDRLNCAIPKCQFYWCYLTPEQWATVRYVSEQEAAPCAKYNVNCPIADNCNGSDATCGQYRRRVEPQAQGWDDYKLYRKQEGLSHE